MDQPDKVVANPSRGQLFPCPRSRLRIWSRETCSVVSPRVILLILHTQAESCAYSLLTGFLPLFAAASMYLYRQPPSDQSRVYQVAQLRCGYSEGLDAFRPLCYYAQVGSIFKRKGFLHAVHGAIGNTTRVKGITRGCYIIIIVVELGATG